MFPGAERLAAVPDFLAFGPPELSQKLSTTFHWRLEQAILSMMRLTLL
jgi:hypothetical protein